MLSNFRTAKSPLWCLCRSVLIGLFTALSAISNSAQAADDQEWQQYQTSGQEAARINDYATAEAFYRKARARAESLDPKSKLKLESVSALVAVLYKEGQFAQAEEMLEESLTIWESKLKPASAASKIASTAENQRLQTDIAHDKRLLAECYRAEGKYKLSEKMYRSALKSYAAASATGLDIAAAESDLADVLSSERRYGEAEGNYREALKILEREHSPELLLDLLEDYDGLLRTTNRLAEAQKIEEQIKSLKKADLE